MLTVTYFPLKVGTAGWKVIFFNLNLFNIPEAQFKINNQRLSRT